MYRCLITPLVFAPLCATSLGQWTDDTSVNQLIVGGASDQAQPKVVPAVGGGFWVSWLDGIASGWDVRVQRLDALGREVFAPGGILVADRSFSSTQDYGLAVSTDGAAMLAFRDDRSGNIEITAVRVSPGGNFEWGANGIQLTSGAGFVAAPKIVRGTARGAIVGWTEDTTVRFQWINGAGSQTWAAPLVQTPTVGAYSLADLAPAAEDAIASIVHQTGGFSSPRHLVAQRVDRLGSADWGSAPVPVFTSGSLQFGNFPKVTAHSGTESTWAWYSSSPSLQCFVQRLDANGAPLWTAGGVPVATTPGAVRVNPVARIVPVDFQNDEVIVAWREQNPSQSLSGISLQRFDRDGTRLWGDGGTSIVPVGASGANAPTLGAPLEGDDVLITWEEAPSFGADRLYGARLDSTGAVVAPRFDVASTASSKSRHVMTRDFAGTWLLTWGDERNDGGDVYGQAFSSRGVPGGPLTISIDTCPGVPNSTGRAASTYAVGSPAVAAGDVQLVSVDLPQNAFLFYLTSRAPDVVPNPGGSAGTLCLGGSIGRFVGPGQIVNASAGAVATLELDLTQHPTPTGLVAVAAGERWYFQGWYRDIGGGTNSNFTSAVAVDFR